VLLALALLVAYLFGSIPSGVVLSRVVAGEDVRIHGSGNSGASNVARTFGARLGVVVGALDVAKGLAAVLVGRWLGTPSAGLALVAAAAVVGQDFSVFLRFRGGKGVATTLGVALGLALVAGALAIVIWVLVIAASRYSSLASLVALGVLPIFIAALGGAPSFIICTIALFVLALWKHRENITRLWNGTERKFRSLTPANGA
jgi:glycerol-3-phosphate acyltransferase PlsY